MAKRRKNLSHGDDISRQSHVQDVEGNVMRKVDEWTEAADRTVDASKEEPHYEVQKDKAEKQAARRPESMSRKTDRGGS